MTSPEKKIKHLHTVRYTLKDGTLKVVRYHRLTRRRIHSEPGTRAFNAEFAWAAKTEENRGRKRVAGKDEAKVKTGFVYLVEATGLGLVKIGWAKDVKRRLLSMQSGSPAELVLLAAIPATPVDEVKLHARFAHLRHKREWFTLTEEVREFISELD